MFWPVALQQYLTIFVRKNPMAANVHHLINAG